jgi:hypothetical protein
MKIDQRLMKIDGDIDQRFTRLDGDLNQRFGDVYRRFANVEGEIKLLSRMIGFNLAGTVGIIFMLLRH